MELLFLSTLSLRRATYPAAACRPRAADFYPRSPCGERPILGNPCAGCPAISIHALLAESDDQCQYKLGWFQYHFYPRSPCGERLRGWTLNINGPIFLSTLSLRRATPGKIRIFNDILYFYPRSPCGERRAWPAYRPAACRISIHALLAESDGKPKALKSRR